jgi:hypothetical protein
MDIKWLVDLKWSVNSIKDKLIENSQIQSPTKTIIVQTFLASMSNSNLPRPLLSNVMKNMQKSVL